MAVKLLGIGSLYGAFVLLPIHFVGHSESLVMSASTEKSDYREIIPSIGALPSGSPFFLAHTVFVWYFTLVSFYVFYTSWQQFVALRHEYLLLNLDTTNTRTIMISGLPAEITNEKMLLGLFSTLNLGTVDKVSLCRHYGQLEHMINRRVTYSGNSNFPTCKSVKVPSPAQPRCSKLRRKCRVNNHTGFASSHTKTDAATSRQHSRVYAAIPRTKAPQGYRRRANVGATSHKIGLSWPIWRSK